MDITTLIYNLLLTVITTGLPIIIAYIVSFIKQHTNAKQLNTAKILAKNAVLFTKQVSSDLQIDNSTKLASAINSATQLGKNYGINLNENQWRSLVEASLIEIKKGLNNVTSDSNIISNTSSPIALIEDSEATQAISNEKIEEISPTNTLIVPESTMQTIYTKVLEKATKDAELAVNQVIENVQKSISEDNQ